MLPRMQRKLFDSIGSTPTGVGLPANAAIDTMLRQAGRSDRPSADDWTGDADWARLQQQPLRARALLYLVFLTLAALLGWASVAEVDEVARGDARVVPTSKLQIVQSVDGGVVEELLVQEGQTVDAGAVLLRIDPTRFVSTMLESKAMAMALEARVARLEALTQGGDFAIPAVLEKEIPDIVAQERQLYASSRATLESQLSIARQHLSQRRQELNEALALRAQAASSLDLATRELKATKPLVTSGAVSDIDVLRLEREVAMLRGEGEKAAAQISRVQSAISEAEEKIREVELAARNAWRTELAETMGKLGSLTESARGLQDKVKHAEIRAPLRGTVKRLLVNTVGAVVLPGKEVVEIVPLDDVLILEARVTPRDIAFLRPNLPAVVKFTAYDYTIYGGLDGHVEHISADSVFDEKGNPFFIVRVRTDKTTLGEGLPIIPGMVASVDILTGKKTVLTYLLKPVLRAKANALSER